jgi:hypothetical protein
VCVSPEKQQSPQGRVASSRRARCHPALSNALFAHDPINSLLLRSLMTLRNDTHRHGVVLRCVICRFFEEAATYCLLYTDLEIDFWNQSPFGDSRVQGAQ